MVHNNQPKLSCEVKLELRIMVYLHINNGFLTFSIKCLSRNDYHYKTTGTNQQVAIHLHTLIIRKPYRY